MITARHIVDGAVRAVDAQEAVALATSGQGTVWIDLVGDDPQIRALLEHMHVDEFVAEDMLQEATHPKAEAHPNLLFLVVCGLDLDPEEDRFELSTIELDTVLGRTWLITHAAEELEVTATATRLLQREPRHGATPAELLHMLLDAMVDEYEPFIDRFIPDRIEQVEELLFDGQTEPPVRREIHLRRRDVQRLQRVAGPQAEAVRRLAGMSAQIAPSQAHLFTDIADRLARVAAQTEALRQQLDTAFGQYQTLVANSQNEVMKVLTMVSATLLPITVVAGIYGMNFEFMPELQRRWGYPMVMTLNVLIVVSSVVFFRWKGWLGRPASRAQSGRSIDLGFGRVLHTPALGARKVTQAAGRLVRRRGPR